MSGGVKNEGLARRRTPQLKFPTCLHRFSTFAQVGQTARLRPALKYRPALRVRTLGTNPLLYERGTYHHILGARQKYLLLDHVGGLVVEDGPQASGVGCSLGVQAEVQGDVNGGQFVPEVFLILELKPTNQA